MKRLFAALALIASTVTSAPPPIKYDVESNFQQVQQLDDQDFVQGAGVSLQYRIKNLGRWYALDGLGARWDARSSSTSTQAVQQVATVVTSTTPDYFQVTLDSTETGTALTNWVYSFIVTSGGVDYPIGTGVLNIAASAWTGDGSTITTTTSKAYTDAQIALASNNLVTLYKAGDTVLSNNLTTAYQSADTAASNNILATVAATYLPLAGGTLTGPVTGTTATLTGGILSADYLQLDTTYSNGSSEGRIQWNSEDGTPEVGMPGGNVNLQIGQELLMRVKNTTALTITNGQALAIVTSSGSRPGVALADADAGGVTNIFDGMATEDIGSGSIGYMCMRGLVRGIDTRGYSEEGVKVYLSETAGELTETAPAPPANNVIVGTVVVKSGDGVILVASHPEKSYTQLDSRYVKTAGDTMTGTLAMGANNITGTGAHSASTFAAGTHVETPLINGVSGLQITDGGGNLAIFVDSGGKVGVGTASVSEELDVAGSIAASDSIEAATNITAGGTVQGEQLTSTDDAYVADRLGIGVAAPQSPMHIDLGQFEYTFDNDGPSNNGMLSLWRNDTSIVGNNPLGYIAFAGSDTGAGSKQSHALIYALAPSSHATNDTPAELYFQTTPELSGTPVDRLRIAEDGTVIAYGLMGANSITTTAVTVSGNVGIGTASPSAAGILTVAGNIVPSASNTYTLGTAALPWSEVYVGSNSLYIGGVQLSRANGGLAVNGAVVVSGDDPTSYVGFDVVMTSTNSGQVVAADTLTKPNFDNVLRDTGSGWSTSNDEYTVPAGKGGTWGGVLQFEINGVADGKYAQGSVRIESGGVTNFISLNTDHASQQSFMDFCTPWEVELSAGDRILPFVRQNDTDGGNETLAGYNVGYATRFTGRLLAD
jgi:hypothetical protein